MSDTVYRLVYYSRNRLTGSDADKHAEIEHILDKSRRNNAAVGVTGALMFNAGYFAQVLEGPQAIVESTFERIQQDARHGDVSLLSFAPAPRTFEAWSMAFVGQAEGDVQRFGTIAERSGFDPSAMSGDRMFEILREQLLEEEVATA